mgnify:CR=1 FL=1
MNQTVFEPFDRVNATAAYLAGPNMDTDQIIPGRFLKKDRAQTDPQGRRVGYSPYLFFDARFDEQGRERAAHPLNAQDKPKILLVDDNFGCGSSREGAVYALADYGIRAVISTSFGDIFFNNCFKNGVLAIRLPAADHQTLRHAFAEPQSLTIDLPAQSIVFQGTELPFEVDDFSKACLMQGVDELALTLSHADDITRFEHAYWQRFPWLAAGRQA